MTNQSGSSTASGCAKAFGIGCASIILLVILLFTLGSNGGPVFMFLLVGGLVTFAIVSSRRKTANLQVTPEAEPTPPSQYTVAAPPTRVETPSNFASSTEGDIESPLCRHMFTKAEVAGSKTLICPCGYRISPSDLREYLSVQDQINALEDRRQTLWAKMKDTYSPDAKPGYIPSTSASSASTVAAAPVVAKPKVVKPKRRLSTQQWLVIGASILIVVAGLLFVNATKDHLPQWAFQLITVGLAVAMAFGSIYMRKISSLLASFFTAFSAAMQLATMSIIGDQLFDSFTWDSMPAYWWAVSLAVIAVVASVLAKFTKIFGWKAIALLSATAAVLVLDLGVLFDKFVASAATIHLAIMTITSVGILWLGKWLRAIPNIEETDKALKAYAKELAGREDTSLRLAGMAAGILQLVAGIGVFLIQYVPVADAALEPISLALFAAVAIGVQATSASWSGQLTAAGGVIPEFASIARHTIHVTLTLAALSIAGLLPNSWLSAIVAVALVLAVNQLAGFYKPLTPTATNTIVSVAVATVIGFLWLAPDMLLSDSAEAEPVYLFGLVLVLLAHEWRNRTSKFDLVAGIALPATVVWYTALASARIEDPRGWGNALVTLVLLLAASIAVPARSLIARRAGTAASAVVGWLGLAGVVGIAFVPLVSLSFRGVTLSIQNLVPINTVYLVYAAGAFALTLWTKFGKSHLWLTQAHGYFAQFMVGFSILTSTNVNAADQNATYTVLLVAMAVLNYVFGWLSKQSVNMQVGFGFALLATIPLQQLNSSLDFVVLALITISVVTALGFIHEWLINKLSGGANWVGQVSALAGITIGLLLTTITQWQEWNGAKLSQQLTIQALLWLISIGTSVWCWRAQVRGGKFHASVWWLGLIYVCFAGLVTLLVSTDAPLELERVQALVAALMIGLVAIGSRLSKSETWLIVVAYGFNLLAALRAGDLTAIRFSTGAAPEPYSFWVIVALIGTTLLLGSGVKAWRSRLLVDIPVSIAALATWIYSLTLFNFDSPDALVRGLIALAIIAGFAYWKSGRELPVFWLAVGYLAGAGAALYLGRAVLNWIKWNHDGPEAYSILVVLSVVLGNYFLTKRLGKVLTESRVMVILGVLTIPTLMHSLVLSDVPEEARIRQLLALAVIAGSAIWRFARKAPKTWAIPAYAGSILAMLAAGDLIHLQAWKDFDGPELYSVPAVIAVLICHRFILPGLNLKSSWLAWGIPMGALVIPSAVNTAVFASTPFADLTAVQVTRVILVLVASVALLVFGVRLGNLANTTVGLVGLTLLLVPNTALRADSVLAGSQVESTALVIGILVFILLAVLKQQGVLKGRSTVFIGIPIALVMGPAVVRSLLALGNPTLTNIDWWRFGIVLAAGMALLIIGALRELGGMFFPGLASVILTALPYGFMQTKDQDWFLWVVLLLVAGAMVWVALRLEQLRKAGRNSANWLRELK